MPSNNILIDWLSWTTTDYSVYDVIEIIGLSGVHFEESYGVRGYASKLWFEGVNIHFGGEYHDDVWLEISGQGCRTFESHSSIDWSCLLSFVKSCGHLTRLDIAYDDKSGVFDMARIYQDAFNHEYVSKAKSFDLRYSDKGCTVTIGSSSSDVLIRIYDKSAERHCSSDVHWVRLELQLRDERALSFLQSSVSLGDTFVCVVNNYLRFVDSDTDTNRWRWRMKDYWQVFIDDAQRIKLWVSPGQDYNLDRAENFVYKQAGNAVFTLIQLYGQDVFYQRLKEYRPKVLNPKYLKLLGEYRGANEKNNNL